MTRTSSRISARRQNPPKTLDIASTNRKSKKTTKRKQTKGMKRVNWSKAEDAMLKSMVLKLGENSWKKASSQLKSRSPKQCYQRYRGSHGSMAKLLLCSWCLLESFLGRWFYALKPERSTRQWTQEEDAKILKYHATYGNQWTKISQVLTDR